MRLEQLQREMQLTITQRAGRSNLVRGIDTRDEAERLAIYANAYVSRLQEALAHNFPILQRWLGDTAFASLAHAYIDAHPSNFSSIRNFGDRFPEWLQEQHPDEPWLYEFAKLEWSLGCAFDAPTERTLEGNAFFALPPHDWPLLRLKFARAVRRLTLATNAAQLYASTAEREPSPDGCVAHLTEWLVWRHEFEARYRSMEPLEALAIDALMDGSTFGEMCERLLEYCNEDQVPLRAASYLKRWMADELIVTFCCEQT